MPTDKTDDTNRNRNNLDKSSSPYLLQHLSNPIWWHEWSEDLVRYAAASHMPLLVSVGYATCHWCHVMAAGAFSDIETARYLNEHFICIKVDREQRPDIDQFMMDFINRQNGRGGWPLNVFLTSSMNPVFALTYAPAVAGNSMNSFLSIAEQVYRYIDKNSKEVPVFESSENKPSVADESRLIEILSGYYDAQNGGFGGGQKFPPHTSLLFLLYQLTLDDNPSVKSVCSVTLDAMCRRGLTDHLQGGIFRYCVDNEWTIPHFEKMLYDQAMALWTYSLAYAIMGNERYKVMSLNIIRCLEESFENSGFYISAHDADTDHVEGATYTWSYEQLKNELNEEEFTRLSQSYFIDKQGNFEGCNHLIRKNDGPLKDIEEKLLTIRRKRKQPSPDEKILSGINSLVAISFIQAGRLLGKPELELKAAALINNIIDVFWDGRVLGHSYWNGLLQKQGFLSDASALLIAISMLCESNDGWRKLMNEIAVYIESFKDDDKWIESGAADFKRVYASWFDHPVPSGASMAEFGSVRVAILSGRDYQPKSYLQPFQSDFYNLAAMMSNGLFHIITSPETIPWNQIPVNSIQVRGSLLQDCFNGICTVPSGGIVK